MIIDKHLITLVSVAFFTLTSLADEDGVMNLELDGENSVDIRRFYAEGENLLIGLPCDAGDGIAEMHTAAVMASDDLEVWMPDLINARFLPDLKSSVKQIPASDVARLIDFAIESTGKRVYLISSGVGSSLLLRGLLEWEQQSSGDLDSLGGVILMFPRLNAAPPEPGRDPQYIAAVGKTQTSIVVLEGEKTPNSWSLESLAERLRAGGSKVITSVIPGVRGYFYDREQPNRTENVVTSQMDGLVKASLIKLQKMK